MNYQLNEEGKLTLTKETTEFIGTWEQLHFSGLKMPALAQAQL